MWVFVACSVSVAAYERRIIGQGNTDAVCFLHNLELSHPARVAAGRHISISSSRHNDIQLYSKSQAFDW